MEKRTELNLWYLVAAIFGVLFIQGLIATWQETTELPYSRFLELVDEGRVDQLVIGSETISDRLVEPLDGRTRFVTARVEPDLAERLDRGGVEYTGQVENTLLTPILSWLIPIFLFFAIWMFFFRRFAEKQGLGGFMSVGKSRAKVYVEKETGIGFADVAGVDEPKGETSSVGRSVVARTFQWRRRRTRSRLLAHRFRRRLSESTSRSSSAIRRNRLKARTSTFTPSVHGA